MFKKWVKTTSVIISILSCIYIQRVKAGDLDIKGSYYEKIMHMKDVIADILPPPAYIIESYLVVLQILDSADAANADGKIDATEMKNIDSLIEYGKKLKDGRSDKNEAAGYLERINVWKKDLPETTADEKKIKNIITVSSVEPANQFYTIRDTKFIPAIKAGKVKEATQIVRSEMKSVYESHRKQIDELVSLATKAFEAAEKEATNRLAKGESGGDLRIRGKLYNQIISMKDLIADILPPPCYIIESLLVVMEMIDEVDANGGKVNDKYKKSVEYGNLLKNGKSAKGEIAGYLERQEFWMKNLSEKSLAEKRAKELMVQISATPAKKFFDIRDSKLIPALNGGQVAEAKKILREQLKALYDEHRKAIDELVSRADKVYKQLEADVGKQLLSQK